MSYKNFMIRTFVDGKNSRDAKINDAKHILNLEFFNDPSYCDSMFRWIAGRDSHLSNKIDIRLFNRKYSAANGYTTMFEMKMDESPNVGDYYYDKSRKQYWILTELFEVNHIHYSGKLTLCNWVLKWQDEDGNIIEYPCQDINSTQYNSGEFGNQTLTLGSAQHMATVQATPDTIALKSPRRFFISRDNMIPFKITQNDTVSNLYGSGLCKITLTQDQLNEAVDRPDLGLCDYIQEKPSQTPENPDETLDLFAEIVGSNTLKIGLNRTYSVVFKDRCGDIVNDVDFEWCVESDFEVNTDILSNKDIRISVKNDKSLIGKELKLKILIGETIISFMKVQVTGLY